MSVMNIAHFVFVSGCYDYHNFYWYDFFYKQVPKKLDAIVLINFIYRTFRTSFYFKRKHTFRIIEHFKSITVLIKNKHAFKYQKKKPAEILTIYNRLFILIMNNL